MATGTLTPTLTLSSTDLFSDTLSLSNTDSLSITGDREINRTKMAGSSADTTIFANGTYTRAMVYLKNVDSTTAILVDFGSQLSMQIEPGEFAFFPWDSSGDLVAKSEDSNTPILEHGVFEF